MQENSSNLTIIIPIDLDRRGIDILEKLKFIVHIIIKSNFELSIGHNDKNSQLDKNLKNFIKSINKSSIKQIYLHSSNVSEYSNMAKLRNIAFSSVKTEYILLLDVDIYPDIKAFEYFLHLAVENNSFSMAPCLYLTEKGTKELKNNFQFYKKRIVKEYLQYSRNYVLHLAIPSSVIFLKSDDFKTLNGFNEDYSGHGYEDFDFMIKLAVKYNLINLDSSLLIDKTYVAPLLSFGFRAELAKLCLENVLDKKFVFHLHHPRNSKEGYYKAREKNSEIFKKYLESLVEEQISNTAIPPLIFDFYELCEKKNINPDSFLVLLDGRPKNMDRKSLY